MGEYLVNLENPEGKDYQVTFNDVEFKYFHHRKSLPENTCLEIIDNIKKISGKKIAIIYGNCQTDKLQLFFLNHKIFSEQYFLITIPAVCNYLNDETISLFQENFWSLCDLLISQRVSNDNRYSPLVATQKLPLLLPETAKIIWIPNVYFDGYFPQQSKNPRNVGTDLHQSGLFPAGDKFVDAFLDGGGGIKVSELVDFITAQNFISESEVLAGVENSFSELKKREWACDIHMLDFVIDNYKRQIFYSPNHPTQNVILELARRILKFMDISDTSFQNVDSLMSEENSLIGQDIPIYPKVKEILGLKDSLENFYANKYFPTNFKFFRANYVDFLVAYATTCWKDKLIIE